MTKTELNALADHLNYINNYIKKYSDVPVKAMNEYSVDDIVKLRNGYEMIQNEINTIKAIFIEED